MEILRFLTAGSVDDGKSTLIGRLLFDSGALFDDYLQEIGQASYQRGNSGLDLSLVTDGLRAEREQGITIDVAYRYFSTPERRFVVIDAPGHLQYTRNMLTGSSQASAIVLLVDATKGLLEQTRRHAFLAHLLRLQNFIVCVNKMDSVGFDELVFKRICSQFLEMFETFGVEAATWNQATFIVSTPTDVPPITLSMRPDFAMVKGRR